MIRTNRDRTAWEHAQVVQQRRVDAGKRGYAKAVRRYLKRDFSALGEYGRQRAKLPVAGMARGEGEAA